jgi:hypothetical protein
VGKRDETTIKNIKKKIKKRRVRKDNLFILQKKCKTYISNNMKKKEER